METGGRNDSLNWIAGPKSTKGWHVAVEGNIRIFATIDFGQSVVSRMIASFIQAHPAVTTELAYSNRPLHMIEGDATQASSWEI